MRQKKNSTERKREGPPPARQTIGEGEVQYRGKDEPSPNRQQGGRGSSEWKNWEGGNRERARGKKTRKKKSLSGGQIVNAPHLEALPIGLRPEQWILRGGEKRAVQQKKAKKESQRISVEY